MISRIAKGGSAGMDGMGRDGRRRGCRNVSSTYLLTFLMIWIYIIAVFNEMCHGLIVLFCIFFYYYYEFISGGGFLQSPIKPGGKPL